MQSVDVDDRSANVKIEKYIQTLYPRLSYSTLQKAFRKKDIKANGARVGRDYLVMPGDKLEIYIVDDLLAGLDSEGVKRSGDTKKSEGFSVVYEDENILIVNKAQGIPVHPDKEQTRRTLIDLVREYLIQKGGAPSSSANFQPALCHRLDRNTGGLVIIAKNPESHDIILQKLESREIEKHYQCLVKGKMDRQEATLKAYLWKDADKSRVFVSGRRTTGSMEIITGYKVLKYDPSMDVSRLEVELITGRTHQIRAHLAFTGHPVIGDGKYGTNAVNRFYGRKQQALWACRIKFAFSDKNPLDYLNGKEIKVDPDF
jgi:23S rRNA pseudouridine955/2504/2580 synthase